MSRFLRTVIFLVCFLSAGRAFAAGGACPANTPVTGNNCYFIAATGADTNNGTSESSPWLHAPGMPNCTANCAAVLNPTPSGYNTTGTGLGFIFRGGDTWHEGNSSLSPYTGGIWVWRWSGTPASCVYEGTVSGCSYIGVDTTWYNSSVCGASWCRPIVNGDNPTSTSTVSSCTYEIGATNALFGLSIAGYTIAYDIYLDSFEFTGFCGSTTHGRSLQNGMVIDNGTGTTGEGFQILNNLYFHGWTTTSLVNTDPTVCTILIGGIQSLWAITNLVIDGSDSNPAGCVAGAYPAYYHYKDSIVRYATDQVGSGCHDIHDNIFEYVVSIASNGHTNILECNQDASGNYPNQPQNTPNVWYNNVIRHSDSNVMIWVCPNTIPEYWFNNLMYDSKGEGWSIAGPPGYPGCPNTGGQFMFNNTFVDGALGGWTQECHLRGSNFTGGRYLTVVNEHLINTDWDGTGCRGGAASATNISMTDAQATKQGYTTGSAGTYLSNNCAQDTTTPCAPMASSKSTVRAGANLQAYCTTLASFTSEYAIGTEAANACRYGTTDGCAYNISTHTMVCPAQTAVARPASTAWDAGAYQLSGVQAPTNLQVTVQ